MDGEGRLDERLRAAAMSSAPDELREQVLQQRRWQRAMAAMQPAPVELRAGVLARGQQAAAARRARHPSRHIDDDLPGWLRWLFGAPLRWAPALLVPLCLGLGLGAGLTALAQQREAQAAQQAAAPGPQASVDELLADFWGTPLDDYAPQPEEGAAL